MRKGGWWERKRNSESFALVVELLRWTPMAAAVGVLAGSASGLLLWSLNVATNFREAHRWIIWLLPVIGLLMGWTYSRYGEEVAAGNDLILDEIHVPKKPILFRMTPMILVATFLTHLFGGSAGREGTAVQTGGSLADQLGRPLGLSGPARRLLLMAGMSAGFSSVFGTPLAGAVFGLEVLAVGTITYEAIAPCFLAALVGDWTTRALMTMLHFHHEKYVIRSIPPLAPSHLLAAMAAGAIFGLMAWVFANSMHAVQAFAKRTIRWPALRPFIGGLLVSSAVFALGTTRYIGLGIPTITASFDGHVAAWDFAGKWIFTVVTLGFGFKGGEVTPLFFIGATLGNALSHVLPLSASLLAAMGFAAVFGGAANTPLAATLLAIEMFGADVGVFAAVACVGSYLFSGGHGIYTGQRRGRGKFIGLPDEPDAARGPQL